MRRIIGFESFANLENAAKSVGKPVATYAREALVQHIGLKPPLSTNASNAIQSTFKGGHGSPLHDWYPYLEGYSPEFVQNIIRQYAPDAARILDPFCGSGTTALVAASMARVGLFSEVNPVCRFVIETKAEALKLSSNDRDHVIDVLRSICSTITTQVKRSAQDKGLQRRLSGALGARPVFDTKTLELLLRLRTFLNKMSEDRPMVAPFLTIAALRSLIPSSLLVRRGDLRFRTAAELTKFSPDLIGELRKSIELVASDLSDLQPVPGNVQYVCNNARDIAENIDGLVDAVITSPPYLNGTNYFRNTKVELCFLGHIGAKGDLRQFRDDAITAGINDVTMGKTRNGEGGIVSARLGSTLKKLSASAYDMRIPAMVQSYFQEMAVVIENLKRATRPEGIVAIDLGDSCYGGVHVATDEILADMMVGNGFEAGERIVLRERQSRDGRPLSQTLQVFKRAPKPSTRSKLTRAAKAERQQEGSWKAFRNDLPHQRGEMAKRNWGHSWHSLCSYQGKLKPSIASTLVASLLPTGGGGRFLDPFAGVGTLPFEARLQGHVAFGFDISPAAAVITKAKLGDVDPIEAADLVSRLGAWLKEPKNTKAPGRSLDAIRFNGPLKDYFNPRTMIEIVAARAFFMKHPPASPTEALVMASLLHVLHGNRPYALSRRSHPITPFAPTGPSEYRSLIEKLNGKLNRALQDAPPERLPEGRLFDQDATLKWPDQVCDLDAIITSPPFFDSTRFYSANWMRLWFAGWGPEDFDQRPKDFVDERQKQNLNVYEAVFSQASERLRPGGVMAVHLGKSRKCDMAASLSVIGAAHLNLIDSFAESVDHCESHGFKDKGTVTHHQYLLFRKA